jgi:hypothetical protein
MAIPGIPQNFTVQTGNSQNLISWAQSPGATSYLIQRSLDNVTFMPLVTVTGSPLASSYLDTAVTRGVQYWYNVAAHNSSGTSPYTPAQSAIPTVTGEMSLAQIRLQAQQRADRVNSNFVTTPEWNTYINQALFELYDLLVTCYEDQFVATPIQFVTDGSTFLWPLPDGLLTFESGINPQQTLVPPPFYKLLGVDLALNNATNAYVTINKFMFTDRNRFVYPNTASTLYGVFNMQYRLLGNNLEFIPTPTAGQSIRLWYIPRMTQLLQDTDISSEGVSGWIEYAIVRAAKYALDKEESDTTKLDQELLFLKGRIEESAANRDAGNPDKISDTRSNIGSGYAGTGQGWNGGTAGWAMCPISLGFFNPGSIMHNFPNSLFSHIVHSSQGGLGYVIFCICFAYIFDLCRRKLSARTEFSVSRGFSTFINHILGVIFRRSCKQMFRITTQSVIASIANEKSFWNKAVRKFIDNSMRTVGLLFSSARNFAGKFAVAIFIFCANPRPALILSALRNSSPNNLIPSLDFTHKSFSFIPLRSFVSDQMIRIDAKTIVARMLYLLSFSYLFFKKDICNTMCEKLLVIDSHISILRSVPILSSSTVPFPARVEWNEVDMLKESHLEVFHNE